MSALPQDDGSHIVVIAVAHSISDGISVLSLHSSLWRAYTAFVNGAPQPSGDDADSGLPEPAETWFRSRYSEAEITAFLARRVEFFDTVHPAVIAPTPGPTTGVHLSRIQLTSEQHSQFSKIARSARATQHSLLCAALLKAVRSQIPPAEGPLTLTCVSAVDLRTRFDPPISRGRVLRAVGPACTMIDLAPETDPGDRPKPWEVNLLPLLPAAVVSPVVALASGPPQSSGGVVRARMIRTWRLRRITGRSKS